MCTFQHFFHECKWHWHIGDVFLNILVYYLHFFDFVWISYEVFKLTVKRSKGKSIRGAKWLGQNRWLLGIRGKTDEWDTTRGINLIIPSFKWWTSLCWSYLLYDSHSTFRCQCSEAISAWDNWFYAPSWVTLGRFIPSFRKHLFLPKPLCSSYAFALWPFDHHFENFIKNSY